MRIWPFFDWCVFLYLITLPADQLHLECFFLKPKVNHLLGVFLVGWMICARQWRIVDRRCLLWGGAGIASVALSACFSPFMERSLGYVLVALLTFVLYFLLPLNLMQTRDPCRLWQIYLASFGVIGVHALLQVVGSALSWYDPFLRQPPIWGPVSRGQSWTYEPSFYALYAIPFVCFAHVRYMLGQGSRWQMMGSHLCLLASASTSALMAYGVLMGVGWGVGRWRLIQETFPFWQRRWRRFIASVLGVGALVSLCGIEFVKITFYKCFQATYTTWETFAVRWKGIQAAWEAFLEHPWVGLGVGGVGPHIFQGEMRGEAPVSLYAPTLDLIEPWDPTNAFTEFLASLGLVGCVVGIGIATVVLRLYRQKLLEGNEEERGILLAWGISAIVMLICLQINQGLFRSYVWTHIAWGVGYMLRPHEVSNFSVYTN